MLFIYCQTLYSQICILKQEDLCGKINLSLQFASASMKDTANKTPIENKSGEKLSLICFFKTSDFRAAIFVLYSGRTFFNSALSFPFTAEENITYEGTCPEEFSGVTHSSL